MNIQEMISKMSPQMLSQALGQLSGKLSPEQLRQAESAIKSMSQGNLKAQLQSLSADQLTRELQNNPNLSKQLAQNPELMKALMSIVGKK